MIYNNRGIHGMKSIIKIKEFFKDKLDRVFSALFATAGAVLLAQFPQFLAQYLQRLGGHIDEAMLASSKYKLPEIAERARDFKNSLDAIANAPALYKLPEFLVNAQWAVVSETIKNYTPGMAFSEQGLYYLLTGMICGLLLYGLIKYTIRKIYRASNKKKSPPSPPSPMMGGFQNTQFPG